MKNRTCSLIFTMLCTPLAACAPHFGLELEVPHLPDPTSISSGGAEAAACRIKVGSFIDARPSPTIAVIDGRDIPSEGSPGVVVQEGFQRYFRDAGVKVVMRDAPILDGEVVEWRARIEPGFPTSDAVANAKIHLTLKDSEFHVLYNGTFNGEATVSHPMMGEDEVRGLLGAAMGGAVEAAVKEETLRTRLSRGRIE